MPLHFRLRLQTALLGAVILLARFTPPTTAADSPPAADSSFAGEIRPLLAKYCLDCHSTEKQKGDLDLERFQSPSDARREPKVWEGVSEQLAAGEMPPKDKPQPSSAERQRLESWVRSLLDAIALAQAGDPGPVILRRLSNAEYTYTLRDLTGIASLDPAREFPIDGAAGEGFMNTGSALVMSPTLLTKYLDAARDVAQHTVLLPDGIRFSPSTSRRDWTEEALAQIREFYRHYTDPRGSTRVNLQGLVWETNEGGRIPLERYFDALQHAREALAAGSTTPQAIARESGLSAKYLGLLQSTLAQDSSSLLLHKLQAQWRNPATATPAILAAQIAPWQQALWKFGSVGHIGKVGGPKAWMEPVTPIASQQSFRIKLTNAPNAEFVTLRLQASDAGDGSEHDFVVWERPRLVTPGRADLPLRNVRAVSHRLHQGRSRLVSTAAACLAAADAAARHPDPTSLIVADLARQHSVDPNTLQAWLDTLGIRTGGAATISGLLTDRIEDTAGYAFVQGWGKRETPNLVANASDQHVRIPGNLRGHGVALHPTPTLQTAVSWRSPIHGSFQVEAILTHAHPECGNGVTWTLEARRGSTRQRLAQGIAQGSKTVRPDPVILTDLHPGDVVSLLVGPRDGNHSCDLTAIDLILTERLAGNASENPRKWDLAADVSPDILAGNPHPDRLGHPEVWHFHTEPVSGENAPIQALPPNSLLAQWRTSSDSAQRADLASRFQKWLEAGGSTDPKDPNAELYRLIFAPNGLLLRSLLASNDENPIPPNAAPSTDDPGLDPSLFGHHPDGSPIDPLSLCSKAPNTVEFRIPTALATGSEFIVTARLHPQAHPEASAQFRVALRTSQDFAEVPVPDPTTPFITADKSAAQQRLETSFHDFRQVFPAALCYSRIVPVDEVVTLTLFYREDDALRRLMLDDAEAKRLDRLWDELHYISYDALTLVDAFAQLMEYATQDADPKVFEPLREPIHTRAAQFRQRLKDTEPRHLDAVIDFAQRAYRRPLKEGEAKDLRALYARLRNQELPHDEAIRMTLARLLVAPAFLYRAEEPSPGTEAKPVSDWELASRLSYFLWSSTPDDTLQALAAAGRLRDPDTLVEQTRRMIRDPRVRRLATEFGCQWLHIHDFDHLDEKSERHFPTFSSVRGPLYEEAILFFTDFFQSDLSVDALLNADHTFLNQTLAEHYGISGVSGPEWRKVHHVRQQSRGGVLGLGATLAKQSGASRTSPILRGNWISEVILGEKLPKPPKDVPRLPEDEAATEGLTVRQLVERHSQDPRCAGCHVRIDPYGFALEGYDAIGRARSRDLADRPIATAAKTADGATFDGLAGLRDYLLHQRRDAFYRQFSRKLLGYALGRAVQLSDSPLLQEMRTQLDAHEGRVSAAFETIVRSRQFREIRGRDANHENP